MNYSLGFKHVGKVKYQTDFLKRWEMQMEALNCE